MGNNEQTLNSKVKKYIDHLFSDVEPSQQLFDLKEELTTNLKEKIEDYISRGMDEEQAFKEAVITIGDLSGLVEEMRKYRDSGLQQPVF
ncbi:MAG: permease prefix domain 1-containing protein, partial [Thermacetogeniaceae bacterium]